MVDTKTVVSRRTLLLPARRRGEHNRLERTAQIRAEGGGGGGGEEAGAGSSVSSAAGGVRPPP